MEKNAYQKRMLSTSGLKSRRPASNNDPALWLKKWSSRPVLFGVGLGIFLGILVLLISLAEDREPSEEPMNAAQAESFTPLESYP